MLSSAHDYSALLRRLETTHRQFDEASGHLTPARRLELLTQQGGLPSLTAHAQAGPKTKPVLPHMLNAVDSTLDGMIKRLEMELIHRQATPGDGQAQHALSSPVHDPSAAALSAQLRRVLARSRSNAGAGGASVGAGGATRRRSRRRRRHAESSSRTTTWL